MVNPRTVEAFRFEQSRQRLEHPRIVIQQEDCGGSAGMRAVNRDRSSVTPSGEPQYESDFSIMEFNIRPTSSRPEFTLTRFSGSDVSAVQRFADPVLVSHLPGVRIGQFARKMLLITAFAPRFRDLRPDGPRAAADLIRHLIRFVFGNDFGKPKYRLEKTSGFIRVHPWFPSSNCRI